MNRNVVSDAPPAARLEIRRAAVDDAAALAEFGARAFFETFAADNSPEDMRLHLASAWAPQLQHAEIQNAALATLLACEAHGALAGFAQLAAAPPPAGIAAQRPMELKRFYVDKPWQGRGLARELMHAVEREARARGARELWLGVWERNERAQAFYRKHGFRKVGTQIFVVGTDPQTDNVMLRELLDPLHIEHIGVWVRDIDGVAAFYAKYFGARVGELYRNPRKGFESRFLEFDSGARLEIMRRGDVSGRAATEQLGLAHVALTVGDEACVDALAARFVADGWQPESAPRRTGDGYYECVVRDPEGNRVEIAAG